MLPAGNVAGFNLYLSQNMVDEEKRLHIEIMRLQVELLKKHIEDGKKGDEWRI